MIDGSMRFRGIFHQPEAMSVGDSLQCGHVTGIPKDMDGHDPFGGRGDVLFYSRDIHIPCGSIGIHEDGLRSAVADRQRRGYHGEVRDDDFIARLHSKGA